MKIFQDPEFVFDFKQIARKFGVVEEACDMRMECQ